jgi:hypothetical protein
MSRATAGLLLIPVIRAAFSGFVAPKADIEYDTQIRPVNKLVTYARNILSPLDLKM